MKYRESLIVLGIMFLAACSSSEQPKEKPEHQQPAPEAKGTVQQPRVEDVKLSSTSAVVESLDQESRIITLRGPYGNRTTFTVGDRVKNLDKIHVGDRVMVDYYESLAVQVVKPGTTPDSRETMVYSAEPGEKPEGKVVEKATMTATIEQIDRSVPSITLKDKDGSFHTVRVRHPERLKMVKVGDTLKITYRQAVVVSVEPAQPAAR